MTWSARFVRLQRRTFIVQIAVPQRDEQIVRAVDGRSSVTGIRDDGIPNRQRMIENESVKTQKIKYYNTKKNRAHSIPVRYS